MESDRVEVYLDVSGEWRWRRVAANGEIIADSAEGYTRRHDARIAAERALSSDVPITWEVE